MEERRCRDDALPSKQGIGARHVFPTAIATRGGEEAHAWARVQQGKEEREQRERRRWTSETLEQQQQQQATRGQARREAAILVTPMT
jgi:hypothetical protein